MNIAGYIIIGLILTLLTVVALGAIGLNEERHKNKKKEAENAQHITDAIEQASKEKSNVRTGNRTNDLRTMADKLHKYANSGK